jgi:lysophospholipase L1-like esterase
MKNKIIGVALITALLVGSCKQEVITLEQPAGPSVPPTPSKGTADFTKFVAIGNSLTAGYQAGALFNEGQTNSLPKILSTQFATVGGGAFNQPDIGSVNGFSSEPVAGFYLGRLILFDPDGSGPRTPAPFPSHFPGSAVTCPSSVTTPPLPAPYNTADKPTAFGGDKAALNNFAVPGILLGQALIPDTGNPASPFFNGLWARFASAPGVKTIMQDAIAANGSFFLFDLGNNDVLGYATTGASGIIPLTSQSSFSTQYNGAIALLLGSSTTSKGVIANIPDVTTIPFFRTVLWNAIAFKPTDATTIGLVNAAYAPYNTGIQNPAFALSAAEIAKRTIPQFAVGPNAIIISDKTLTNLTSFGVPSIRPATKDDLITLTAGAVLGTCVGGDPTKINGITVPLADRYVLMPTEITEIQGRTNDFNVIIKAAADGSSGRIALADVNAAFTALVTARAGVYNGVTITPSFAPPTGAFSEDGVHPNSRGYAFMANIFIDAINTKFSAVIPKVDISKYKGTGLPVNP